MFSFRRKKPIDQDDESLQEIEKIVKTLDQDGTGRIRVKDLESALQRLDEDSRSKPEIKKQVRTFSEWCSLIWRSVREVIFIVFLNPTLVKSLKPKGDRIDGEKFLQIMLERQKQLKLRFC